MSLLAGKKALIFGVANDRSIAWGVAQEFKKQGAQIALSYVNDALKKRVLPLAESIGADFTFEMDVTNDEHYARLPEIVKEHWGDFDILVHSLAFADRADLKGGFVETSREGFKMACDISAFSLVGLSQKLQPLMNKEGSIMAMTYYGSQKVITNYNVMGVAKAALEASSRYLANDLGQHGIRVNCVSAGPIKTLAASGISGFRELLSKVEEIAPMRANVTPEDVGGTAVYLASDLSRGVTGQVLYVDSGLSIMGGF
ncbi:MAG: enoyl-[acyl-carrier-protein] reductase FabI [Halobacteriovoraceae bacterium]|nr:enoyl-[acyl-carrier-protein] reductase FabI [Halobacteriovoraceae bacterium]|tara:strand:- start:5183 stop:5953 length:771 start_codon:yes stop_codon:yes gene_type:complete